MAYKKSFSRTIFEITNYLIMILLIVIFIAPILHVLFASISDPIKLNMHEGMVLRPLGFTLEGYKIVFNNKFIKIGYLNTLLYVTSATLLGILLTIMGGYVLSRKKFVGRNFIMLMITFTMFFNGGLVPYYLVIKGLGLLNNRLALIIPTCLSAFNLIIMRTSFAEIPDSLEESAKIDGANDFTILFKIFVPLSKATISVLILFYAVFHWNAWFNALIFIRDRNLYPLQIFLREIVLDSSLGTMSIESAQQKLDLYKLLLKYCTIIVSIVPILCVYPFIQKYFVKGVMIGAIKG